MRHEIRKSLSEPEHAPFRICQIAKPRPIGSAKVFRKAVAVAADEPGDRSIGVGDDQGDPACCEKPAQGAGQPNEVLQLTAIDEKSERQKAGLAERLKDERVSAVRGAAGHADAAVTSMVQQQLGLERGKIVAGRDVGCGDLHANAAKCCGKCRNGQKPTVAKPFGSAWLPTPGRYWGPA